MGQCVVALEDEGVMGRVGTENHIDGHVWVRAAAVFAADVFDELLELFGGECAVDTSPVTEHALRRGYVVNVFFCYAIVAVVVEADAVVSVAHIGARVRVCIEHGDSEECVLRLLVWPHVDGSVGT